MSVSVWLDWIKNLRWLNRESGETQMPFLRQKLQFLEAIQLKKDNLDVVARWCGGKVHRKNKEVHLAKRPAVGGGTHGAFTLNIGDWVCRHESDNHLYFSKSSDADIAKRWELVPDAELGLSAPNDLRSIDEIFADIDIAVRRSAEQVERLQESLKKLRESKGS